MRYPWSVSASRKYRNGHWMAFRWDGETMKMAGSAGYVSAFGRWDCGEWCRFSHVVDDTVVVLS